MESLHYLLMKTHTILQRKIFSEASGIGLTSGQPKILDYLLHYGESDQKTIASYCEIEQATVGSILFRMEKAGLIVRRQRAGNRRSLYVSLTDKGRDAAEKMMTIFDRSEAEVIRNITPEELEQFKSVLNKICVTLQTGEHDTISDAPDRKIKSGGTIS